MATYDRDAYDRIVLSDNYIRETAASRERAAAGPTNKKVTAEVIEFYSKGNRIAQWLSNCIPTAMLIDGVTYPSSEHYFQMAKFDIAADDAAVQEWCSNHRVTVADQIVKNGAIRREMLAMTPVGVAQYGRSMLSAPIRGDWDRVKMDVMYRALRVKFSRVIQCSNALRETGSAVLIERAPRDSVWAINDRGIGENKLGALLMLIRMETFGR